MLLGDDRTGLGQLAGRYERTQKAGRAVNQVELRPLMLGSRQLLLRKRQTGSPGDFGILEMPGTR